jgi:MFS superfamily sulfate permease-like transporter
MRVFSLFQKNYRAFKNHWKTDLNAGLWVFMFSLPISLAIAQASNFPVSSGLITAIIGGVVVSFLSGSPLSIKGPSISLVVVMGWAVLELSPFPSTGLHYALATLVLAGAIQLLMGMLRLGKWFSLIPNPVIYGVISGISAVVFVQQLYLLSGVTDFVLPSLWLILELPTRFLSANTKVLAIGFTILGILFLPSILGQRFSKNLPGVFWAMLIGIGFGIYFNLPEKGINLMYVPQTWSDLFIQADYSMIFTLRSLEYAFLIALISSVESQLNTWDTEILDVWRRKSSMNRELVVLGIGNLLCGLLGGIPMISTVENSTLNINQKARTYWSGVFQGLMLLAFMALGLWTLRYLPHVSLVAILIYAIYQLNSPKLYKGIWETGKEQFLIFGVAFLLTLFLGIWIGLLGGVIFALAVYSSLSNSVWSLLYAPIEISMKGKSKVKIDIHGAALCTNYLSIQNRLQKLLNNERIIIDLSACEVVEHGFLEQIYQFAYWHNLNDGRMELQGLKNHSPTSKHPLATLKKNDPDKPKGNRYFKNLENLLNERQLDLQAVAATNNTTLETNLTYDGVVLQGFAFARGYEIRYRENKFLKFLNGNPFEFCDVFLSRGLRMSDRNHKMSVCLLTVMDLPLPDFNLQQEYLMDRMWQSIGYEDINFSDFPLFSQNYLLNGEKEKEIREVFSPVVVQFLEQHLFLGLNMEVKNNRVLIYKAQCLLQQTEIEDFIEFTEKFLEVLKQSEPVELE